MLNRLPLELLDEVLLLALPPPSPKSDDKQHSRQRQKLLRSLSFVCKSVGNRAQLRLWREIDLKTEQQTTKLAAILRRGISEQLTKAVKVVSAGEEASAMGLAGVVEQFPALEAVNFRQFERRHFWDRFQLEEYAVVPHLPSLSLVNTHISTFTTHFSLSTLVQLSLFHVSIDVEDNLPRLLTSEFLPSLRHLAISNCVDSKWEKFVFPRVDSDLLEQLDALQIDCSDIGKIPRNLVKQVATPVLLTLEFFHDSHDCRRIAQLAILQPRHLRILPPFPTSPLTLYSLSSLSAFLPSCALTSLHLPRNTHSLTNGSAQTELQSVLAACADGGVEVLWHDETDEEYSLSPSFWRYAKRLKAEKAAAAASRGS